MSYNEAIQVLDGLLLGDGSLAMKTNGALFLMNLAKDLVPRRYSTEQSRKLSLVEHIKYEEWIVHNVFNKLSISSSPGYPKVLSGIRQGNLYEYAHLSTLQSTTLTEMYKRWYAGGDWTISGTNKYIHNATKILPTHLMSAPTFPILTLAHFFLNDGGSRWARITGSSGKIYLYPTINFSAHNFSNDEVNHLENMFNNMGIKTVKPAKYNISKGSGLCIYISRKSINRLMDIIEPPMLDMFGDSVGPTYMSMIKRLR